jgi:hypothetical protein
MVIPGCRRALAASCLLMSTNIINGDNTISSTDTINGNNTISSTSSTRSETEETHHANPLLLAQREDIFPPHRVLPSPLAGRQVPVIDGSNTHMRVMETWGNVCDCRNQRFRKDLIN